VIKNTYSGVGKIINENCCHRIIFLGYNTLNLILPGTPPLLGKHSTPPNLPAGFQGLTFGEKRGKESEKEEMRIGDEEAADGGKGRGRGV